MVKSISTATTALSLYYGTPGTAAPTLTKITSSSTTYPSAWCETQCVRYYNGKYYGISSYHDTRHGYDTYVFDPSNNTLTDKKISLSPGNSTPRICCLTQAGSYWLANLGYTSSSTRYQMVRRQAVSAEFIGGFSSTQVTSGSAISSKIYYYNNTAYKFSATETAVYLRKSTDSGATWGSEETIAASSDFSYPRSRWGFGFYNGEFIAAKVDAYNPVLHIVYSKNLVDIAIYSIDLPSGSAGLTCGDILKDNSGYYCALYWDGSATLTNSIIVQLY